MSPGEVLLLSASVLVLYAASAIGLATLFGRGDRVPAWLRIAVVPSAPTFGSQRRRVYSALALMFMVVGQGLLVIYLLGSTADRLGWLIVVSEFALAGALTAYLVVKRVNHGRGGHPGR